MWSGHDDEARKKSIQLALAQHTQAEPATEEDQAMEEVPAVAAAAAPVARGKPEAMAAKLASASRLQEKMEELEAEVEAEVVDGPADDSLDMTMDTVATVATADTPTARKETPKKKQKKKAAPKKKAPPKPELNHPTMDDSTRPISATEYENLEQLMNQFCRVPLLAEFSRPVALLHPELITAYSKIVEHPVDLGHVCRKVRKRGYSSLREVQLDVWRIFSNCVRYHSHPTNKEAVPSFVSIALHLRNFFNALWQEYMLPSDPPPPTNKKTGPEAHAHAAFAKRQEDRKRRLVVSGLSCMAGTGLARAASTLGEFVAKGGKVDKLDTTRVLEDPSLADDHDLRVVKKNLLDLQARLNKLSEAGTDYGIDELAGDVKKCYTEDVFENEPVLRMKIAHRLDRWIGKIIVPIYEATCRGVSQSSIWGCMAAAVWARESSKKPYWPALVLGIMAPDHQKEEWHSELTLRNESRLPEKLKTQLVAGKRRAEAALKKQKLGQAEPQSQFLVEFLGTHEFIWVREADIVEEFDAVEDPNQGGGSTASGSKKKRASRSNIANIIGSKIYATAKEEAKWAFEEFELQLQDVGIGASENPTDEDEGYSFPVLCQSDDEADEVGVSSNDSVDVDELNELLATDGLIDFTASGRKNAKKRSQAIKKQKQDAEKKQKADKAKKMKAEQNKKKKADKAKEKESKKEQKELDKRRKKRKREREKALKSADPNKKRKLEPEDLKKRESGRRNLIASKRERAIAIVDGYLNRAVEKEDYDPLGLGGPGSLTIPAAMIDSSGLLGMAMAFRAAAGDLPMPEESGNLSANIKPWDAVNVDKLKKSSERMDALRKQAELMEKEITRLRSATQTRKRLAELERKKFVDIRNKIVAGDNAARINPIEKKKTPSKSKSKSPKTPGSAAPSEADAESHADTAAEAGDDISRPYADSSGDEAMAESVSDDDNAPGIEAEAHRVG